MTTAAFFADRNVVVALHVAIASTLAHWGGPDPLEIRVFHDGLTQAELSDLRRTAAMSRAGADLGDARVELSRVRSWRSLYGSHMPYGRLFLPELLPEVDEVLYLDADVVVELDVREIIRRSGSGPVAAMPAWNFASSHDLALARELGVDPGEPYFHSGLLVLRLEQWRSEATLRRCLEFGDRHRKRLMSHDQTVLNLVCRGRIHPLPVALSANLYPTSTMDLPQAGGKIQNFCGSPKPFDPLGNVLNAHYELFRKWLDQTALAGWSPNGLAQLTRIRRNVRLLRPMLGTAARRAAQVLKATVQNAAKRS